MQYPLITIADRDFTFSDIFMSHVFLIAKMPAKHYEKQLSQILHAILANEVDPQTNKSIDVRKMTCEERYAIFLSYLDITRDKNSLNIEIDKSEYMNPQVEGFSRERFFNDDETISVRHLTGIEAEALEIGCESTNDWLLGAMAITIGCEKLPPIDVASSLQFVGNMIKSRMELLSSLEHDEFNDLMHAYLLLQDEQKHLVNISFDQGIVLERINKRGADDAPTRFQPSAAFSRYAKNILSGATL